MVHIHNKHTMVGFANFTHQYDYRLGETPFYRRGAMGKDPLKTFSAQSTQAYRANASRIRDMRFANSNELNADIALRSKREQMISDIYSGKRNPELLMGVHGKLNPQYSRSGGALSTGRPYIKVMKQKKGKKTRKEGSVGGGRAGQPPRVRRSFVAELAAKAAEMRMRTGFQTLDPISQPQSPADGYSTDFIRRARGKLVRNTAANSKGAGAGAGAGAERDDMDPRALISNITRSSVSSPEPTQYDYVDGWLGVSPSK